MLINLRNALMAGKRLPYDAEVEYLESTGTQWIDTGVACGGDTTFDLSVYTQVSGSMLFGASQAYATNGLYAFQGNNNWLYANYGNSEFSMLPSADTVNKWLSISKTSNTWKVNGRIVYTQSPETFSSGETFALFCRKQNGGPLGMKSGVRFASCKLFNDNGVLVRDFIPVRKGTVGYLYDRVSGRLFGNAGTGDFVVGPDVVPVEYIESHGTEYIDTELRINTATDVVSLSFWTKPQVRSSSVVRYALFGVSDSASKYFEVRQDVPVFNSASEDKLSYLLPAQDSLIAKNFYNVNDEGWHTLEISKTGYSFDGTQGSITGVADYTFARNLLLFAFATLGVGGLGGKFRISSFSVTRSGVKIMDLIPVRVGTDATSWEGAMMDVLTRRIYRNAGTGAFTYGNDLKYPIPAS